MRRVRRIGVDGVPRLGNQRDRRTTSAWYKLVNSHRFRKARLVAFERDGYLCQFCGKPTVPEDRKLKPTAAHWPFNVDRLIALGLDPADPSTFITAHATCHRQADAKR